MNEPNNERTRRKLTLYDYVTYACALLFILFICLMYYIRAVG